MDVTHWAWWGGALALTIVPLAHWIWFGRPLAVSGRYSALVDGVRFGSAPEPAQEDTAALIAALRAETQALFGADAVEAPALASEAPSEPLAARVPMNGRLHLLFFFAMTLGGLLSGRLAGGGFSFAGLRGVELHAVAVRLSVPEPLLLVLGGMLVGFGTRMAGGCTSGHGLCGVSQRQPGSLLATAGFFAAGVGMSFLLGWLA